MSAHRGIPPRPGQDRLARSEPKTARIRRLRHVDFASAHRQLRREKLQFALLAALLSLLAVAATAAAQSYRAGLLVGNQKQGTAPRYVRSPVISGTPIKNDTLTTSSGNWSGTVRSQSYSWEDCDANGTGCVQIPGATSRRYALQASDIGYAIESKVTACNASCRSITSAPTPVVSTALGAKNPSHKPVPGAVKTDSFGTRWRRIGYDNFTVNARMGSWATRRASTIVYRGDGGLRWTDSPDNSSCKSQTWGGTYYPHCFEPSKVLSVHGGMLDFYLHNCKYAKRIVAGCGANPGPIMPSTGTQFQTYGRYTVRVKLVYNDAKRLNQYHAAWLLWPKTRSEQPCAESDYPELDLNSRVIKAFDHWGCHGSQSRYTVRANLTKWHTLTQEWGPGFRRYYFDGRLIGQSTRQVWSGPERWQLKTTAHTIPGDTTSGHLLVDWVWLGTLTHPRTRS